MAATGTTVVDECRRAMDACAALRDEALAQRLRLLHAGWEVAHPLCQQFDDVAAQWAVTWGKWRRLMLQKRAEGGG